MSLAPTIINDIFFNYFKNAMKTKKDFEVKINFKIIIIDYKYLGNQTIA